MKKSLKKQLSAVTATVIAATLVFQQSVVMAMVYKSGEQDLIGSIITPTCVQNDGQSHSDVAVNDNRQYAIVYEDDNCDGAGFGSAIYLQLYDTQTGPNPPDGGPVRVDETEIGDQKNPSISMDGAGNFIVVWQGNGIGDADGIFVRAFNSDGTPKGGEHRVNTHTAGVQDSPKVAIDFDANPVAGNEQHFVVVWHGEGDGDPDGIYLQSYDILPAGDVSPVGSNIQVNTYTAGDQKNPDVALNNADEPLVTWDGPGQGFTTSNEVWMQGYNYQGNPWNGTANNIRVNSTSPASKPAIAANKSFEPTTHTVPGGHFTIVYKAGADDQIYGKLISRCLNDINPCQMGNVELNINATTSDNPDVAMDYLGNFTVTWEQDDTPEGQYVNIHGINYDYLGHRIDNQFRMNDNVFSDGSANQTDSSVTKDKDGEYIVTWTSPHPTQGNDVRFKLYGTDIFKHGQETLAHAVTANFDERDISTAIAPNGNHVIAYVGQDLLSGNARIYFSLYDNNDNVIVQNQVADTVDDSSVDFPSVSFFKDTQGRGVGRFVITWMGNDPLGTTGQQIMYREFDAAGISDMPNELLANPIANVGYSNPKVSAGYYNNNSSAVIDRFALIYNQTMAFPAQYIINSAYHTESGFTYGTLHNCQASANCFSTSNVNNVDLYPDINGNDKIVYTWDEETISANITYLVLGREANGGTLLGSNFQIANSVNLRQNFPDVAFVSPTQYVFTWTKCNNSDCVSPEIDASRYTGDFTGGNPTLTDANIIVYPGGGSEQTGNYLSSVAADTNTGSFLITWVKNYGDTGGTEIDGKFFESAPTLSNFGVGFVLSSTPFGFRNAPEAAMNNNGKAIVGWEGQYAGFGTVLDNHGALFQMLNNPTFVQTLPELPTSAQLTITQGGKTLTIPSTIQFPNITASTMNAVDVERQIDENPAPGQPLYFQLEDLGGNSAGCGGGTCYSVTMSSTDFTYTDPGTGQTYTIPASNVFIKNYDGDHPGVVDTGLCGSSEATKSFIALFGNASDFSLDGSTCDYAPLNTNQTLLNKITNTSDTAKIQWMPTIKIHVAPLTPPGTYTGTITITSA